MRKILRSISLLLASMTLLSAVSCSDNQGETDEQFDEATLMVIPNTLRLKQDDDIPDYNYGDKVSIGVARNETEAGQFIIYAQSDIDAFDVGVSTMTNENGDVLPTEAIDIYAEHYIYVPNTQTITADFTAGYYPDALVPMANYVKAEDNEIKRGKNQGVWIEVSAESDTPAGTYTGKIIVNTDGEIKYLTFEVEVYDFDIGKTTHSMSAFNLWSNNTMYVDQLALSHTYSNQELYEKYYEFMVENRIMPSDVPSLNHTDYKAYAQDLYKYASREEVSSYNVPTNADYTVESGNGVSTVNFESFEEMFREILEVAIDKEFDMFAKMYIYVPYHDEPSQSWQYEALRKSSDGIENIKKKLSEEYADELSALGEVGEQINDSLLGVPNIITIMSYQIMDSLVGYVDTWCPVLQMFMDADAQIVLDERIQAGDNVWWYTAGGPSNPLPNYLIHDHMIGSRLIAWMQKDYNVGGNLYWSSNLFGAVDVSKGTSYTVPRDPWTDPMAFSNAAGDGYLMYPGYKYNVDGPISTLRLSAIRDGQEDYEYLYYLESLLDEANLEYDINLQLSDYVRDLYDRLYTKVKPIVDQEEFIRVREEIVNLIYALQDKDFSLIVQLNGCNADEQTQSVTVFAASGAEITINGQKVAGIPCGNGMMYNVGVPLSNDRNEVVVQATKGDKTLTLVRNVGGKTKVLENFENANDAKDCVAVSGVTASIEEGSRNVLTGQKSLKVDVEKQEIATSNYVRFRSAKGYDFTDAASYQTIEMDVYNASSETIVLNFATNQVSAMSSFYVEGYEKAHISVSFACLKEAEVKDLSYFQITFSNHDATLYLDNIIVTYKQYSRVSRTVKTSDIEATDVLSTGAAKFDSQGNLILTSFEEKQDLQRVILHNLYNSYASQVDNEDCVTDGSYALEIIYNGVHTMPGNYGEPSIRFYRSNNAFTGFYGADFDIFDYKTFEFDITNYGDTLPITVHIANQRTAKTTDYVTIPAGESMHVVIDINKDKLNAIMVQEDFGELFYISIAWSKPGSAQVAKHFFIDNVKLCK